MREREREREREGDARRFDQSPFIVPNGRDSSQFRLLFDPATLPRPSIAAGATDRTKHLAKKRAISTREIIPRQAAGFYAETTLAEV